MMKEIKILCLLISAAALSQSCYYDNKEDLYQNFGNNNCDTANVTYSSSVEAIVSTNCAVSGCHISPNAQNNLDLSQFGDVKAIADDGQLIGRITGTSGALMPPGGKLPNCDIEKIQAWVAAGAQQN